MFSLKVGHQYQDTQESVPPGSRLLIRTLCINVFSFPFNISYLLLINTCFFPGENGFFFDGKTYVEIPEGVVPEDIGDKFTISTWVKMSLSKGRQTIIANTDKERLDRVYFALSTSGTKLLFEHRREAIHASRDLYCNASFQYKPSIFDSQWHHIVVIADGCSAKLFIDGEHLQPVITTPDWTLHKSKLKNRLSIGARYLAKEGVYTEKFTGYLSGLVIRPNSTLHEQVWWALSP